MPKNATYEEAVAIIFGGHTAIHFLGKAQITELGVNNIVHYDKEDFTRRTEKFDIIFDAIGKYSKNQCNRHFPRCFQKLHLLKFGLKRPLFKAFSEFQYF